MKGFCHYLPASWKTPTIGFYFRWIQVLFQQEETHSKRSIWRHCSSVWPAGYSSIGTAENSQLDTAHSNLPAVHPAPHTTVVDCSQIHWGILSYRPARLPRPVRQERQVWQPYAGAGTMNFTLPSQGLWILLLNLTHFAPWTGLHLDTARPVFCRQTQHTRLFCWAECTPLGSGT